MMPYILHVSVIVIVCFLFYKLFLQKATFYGLNRWILLACLAASFILPLLPAPRGWNWWEKAASVFPPALGKIAAEKSAMQPGMGEAQMHAGIADGPGMAESGPGVNESVSDRVAIGAKRDETVPGRAAARAGMSKPHSQMTKFHSGVTQSRSGVIGIHSGGNEIVSGIHETAPAVAAPPMTEKLNNVTSEGAGREGTGNEAAGIIWVMMIIHALFYAYLIGVCLFGARFILQIAVLCYQAYTQPVIRDGQYRIVETSGNRAPCSFGNNIFINPGLYDPETYQQILIHEKIHVSGRHTLDILLTEIAVVLQWFNPFIWFYRREVENNLEFLTDQSVLMHRGIERSAYQLSLLRVSAPHLPFSITNNYNQSLLKRRIVMMNSQCSPRSTVWKYFFLLPLLTVLVFILNKPAAFSQTATTTVAGSASEDPLDIGQLQQLAFSGSPVFRDTTIRPGRRSADAQPAVPVAVPVREATPAQTAQPDAWSISDVRPVINLSLQPEVNLSLQPEVSLQPAVSLQLQPAISLQTEVNLQPAIAVQPLVNLQTEGATNIEFTPDVRIDPGMHVMNDTIFREGSWFVSSRGDEFEFELRAGDEDHSWGSDLTVKKGEIDPFPGQGNVTFKVVREAGTMTFKGQFDGQQGFGHFQFQPDPAYFQALKQMGVEDIEDNNEESFFLRNVKKDYVAMLQHNGYMPMSRHSVISLAAMNIDADFLQSMKGSGIEGLDDVHGFVTLKAMHIDKAYIDDLRAAGYDHLTVHELVSLKAQHIDGQYVRSMAAGRSDSFIPPRELIAYKASGIDSAYLASIRKLGYTPLDRHDIFALHSMHVTPDFIKGFQDAGLTNLPLHTLVSFKASGVTPEYAKAFHDLGYTDIETNRLVSLKSMGITPDFVQEFHKIGFDHIPFNLLTSLKAMGIDAAYVAKMKEKGFDSQDLRKYMRLKQDFN